MSNLLILGAGGFGHMVYECARQSGKYEEIAFLDDAAKDSRVIGKCVDYQIWREKFPHAVAAFGNNRMRLAWVEKLQEAGFDVPCLCHPSAIVSPSVQMEAGCFVMQRAVLNTHVKLGKGVLINSGAIVDHDSDVGKVRQRPRPDRGHPCCDAGQSRQHDVEAGGRRSDQGGRQNGV